MILSGLIAGMALLSLLPEEGYSHLPDSRDGRTDCQIVGGSVFDTRAGRFVRNPGLAVRQGRFVKFSATEPTDKRIELQEDDYILPGLIDCHALYNVKLIRKRREEFNVIPVQYLANGEPSPFHVVNSTQRGCKSCGSESKRETRSGLG